MRSVLAMFACLGLTGCILPPVISYTSMAFDGVSYIATGKSVSDHALSAAMEEDCAVWRVVSEQDVEAVCQDYAEGDAEDAIAVAFEAGEAAAPPTGRHPVRRSQPAEIALATVTPAEPAAKSDITPMPGPVDLLLGIDPAKLPADPRSAPDYGIEPAAAHGLPAATNRAAVYLVIGSFRTIDRAERLAARIPGITTAIASTLVGDDHFFRVVVGPYDPEQTGDAQSRLAAAGIGNTWAASLCTGDFGAPPCGGP